MNFVVTLPGWVALVVAYGITFGLQNKVPRLHRLPGIKSLVRCTYCTGFHAGWVVWAMSHAPFHLGVGGAARTALQCALEAVLWGFGAAAFSYGVDAAVQAAERSGPRPPIR